MSISLGTTAVHDIPVLSLAPDEARRCPAIFLIPGLGGRKEDGLSLGYRLARRGFFVASFDPWLHGERYDPRLARAADRDQGAIYPPETGLDTFLLFLRVIHQCLADVQTLIAHYAADARVDVARCGVTGVSMGGYASFLVFANLSQVQAAVPMIGLPAFARRWLDLLDECAFSNREWAAALVQVAEQTRQHTAFVQGIDPYEKLKAAAPRALFMMNCDFDTDQPKSYSISAYRELLPHYAADPDKLRLAIYPAGHTVTPQMEQDAADWFSRNLLSTR
jgi:fermentation-respiration switch protein FrsA (DUF1100 family)